MWMARPRVRVISELTRTYQTTNPCQRTFAARKTNSSISSISSPHLLAFFVLWEFE